MVDGRGGAWQPHALLDDPDFLRTLVERTVQAILEAEMAAHLGAALGGLEVGLERRAAERWRRAARGDHGDLLEERLGQVTAAGEVGRARGCWGNSSGRWRPRWMW